MPEGPEVETIRRSLEERLRNQRIASVWRSDFALRTPTQTKDFKFLIGDSINSLSRLGKILSIQTDKGRGLFIHFGMSGRLFYPQADAPLEKHTHLRIHFAASDFELRFIDPRRFGNVKPYRTIAERDDALANIGPDAILFTPAQIKTTATHMRKSQRSLKAVLLDQSIVSGVGNIYACEALHLAKLSPEALASDVSARKLERLLSACQEVMLKAVDNKGTTFMSYLDGNGDKGGNQNHLRVFAKENKPCPVCNSPILRIVQSGRSTFYCRSCQG